MTTSTTGTAGRGGTVDHVMMTGAGPYYAGRLTTVHIMTNTALTGATYDIDGGQQLVAS